MPNERFNRTKLSRCVQQFSSTAEKNTGKKHFLMEVASRTITELYFDSFIDIDVFNLFKRTVAYINCSPGVTAALKAHRDEWRTDVK